MSILDGLSDEQLVALITSELTAAPPVTVKMAALTAYHLVAVLQLACRHPEIDQRHITMVKDFIRQLGPIGPVTAATLEMGWDKSNDKEWASRPRRTDGE